MAILTGGEGFADLPAETGSNGYVIHGGEGRIKLGTGANETYLNVSDIPFDSVTGGIHVPSANLNGLEVLGNAVLAVTAATTATPPHRVHVGGGNDIVGDATRAIIGGKGKVNLVTDFASATDSKTQQINLFNVAGTIQFLNTDRVEVTQGIVLFYIE